MVRVSPLTHVKGLVAFTTAAAGVALVESGVTVDVEPEYSEFATPKYQFVPLSR